MPLSNALFFVSVLVCPLLLRQSYGQNETTAAPTDAHGDLTSDAYVPTTTTLRQEPKTDLSPFWNDTTYNTDSTTVENTTTLYATAYTTEGPLSFNATDNITSSSVSTSSSSSPPPVNSTSESLPSPAGGGGGQRFDLASFFGGIILAAGLLALVFFIYKVWQSKRSGYSNIS